MSPRIDIEGMAYEVWAGEITLSSVVDQWGYAIATEVTLAIKEFAWDKRTKTDFWFRRVR